MLLLISLLVLWILIGLGLFLLVGRNPPVGKPPIVRGVDRRLCLVGDMVGVKLSACATGLPSPRIDDGVTPWDIVLVIDHSSSMGTGVGSALQEALKAAVNLVRTTPISFRFSVVEFDHESREICPLTDRKKGLIRAIKAISRGGATDIALGLEVAGRSLEGTDKDDSGRRVAVLLLSDGGSPADPAVAAADALKADPDLLLITVGIGAADMPLLRRIASTPEHCFHADQIEELAALYSEIGRMITGREATEVRVSESFSATGYWGLRGWGELQPSAFSLRDGEFAWLLAALQETPIDLHYTVEALCPGWHPVATQPARLSARIAEEPLHESESNTGPRVLVLPRIPGWQVLWLVLNPLFFLLLGRLYRCEQGVVPRSEPVVPPPRGLDLPPLIQAGPSPEPPLSIRPTLILGLGYAGVHTLVETKRLAMERGARLDMDKLRLLAIDTADELFFPSPRAGLVRLGPQERMTLDRPLEPLIASEAAGQHQYPWLDAARLAAGGARPDLHRGTGSQRTLGRLAVVENRDALEQRIGSLIDALIVRADAGGIDVVVTAGSGGGTGSGGVLHLCWIVRSLLERRGFGDSSTTLVLSAPDAQQDQEALSEARSMRAANHRALLMELDRLSTQRGEPVAPAPGLAPMRRWIDRVMIVGPAAFTPWRAEAVLYPKAAEIVFAWLASDEAGGLRAHFVDQDAANNALTRELGRCLLHRLDPVSHYLYPETLRTYLVVDTLRRTLANLLWDLDEGDFAEYSAEAKKPQAAEALLQAWLDSRPQDADYPWVFNALSAMGDENRLQGALSRGAGPQISSGISPLARNELFDEQRRLARAVLDNWLLQTLNQGWEDLCHSHALALCIHALRELRQRLREGTEVSDHLALHSPSSMVRGEAETVAELATRASSETEALLRRLDDWDRRLGEGSDGGGLMRLLDERSGLLRKEVDVLRDAEPTPGGRGRTPRSPRLPLDWEQMQALSPRFLGNLGARLSERVGWSVERNGTQVHLHLHVQGTSHRRWTLDELGTADAAIGNLAADLIQVGADLSEGFSGWTLAEYPSDSLAPLPVESPRAGQMNQGARGLYLIQGEVADFRPAAQLDRVQLAPFDRRELRIVGCEEHLASDRLWPAPTTSFAPPAAGDSPFVFLEERTAYRGYLAYCRAENRIPAALPPTLTALCRDPAALAALALEGLAGGKILSRDDGLRRVWSVSGLAGLSGTLDLTEHMEPPLIAFQRVANAWLVATDPALKRFERPGDETPEALGRRIGRHELAAAIAGDPWYQDLIAVVWGLLRWY